MKEETIWHNKEIEKDKGSGLKKNQKKIKKINNFKKKNNNNY